MQLATDEPRMAKVSQREWLTQWFAEQFPKVDPNAPETSIGRSWKGKTAAFIEHDLAVHMADVMTQYYALNFIRKPEFMGFNGYNDGVKRTEFNPFAWGGSVPADPRIEEISGASALKPFQDASRDQNHLRFAQWLALSFDARDLTPHLPAAFLDAYFELVLYPVAGSVIMNDKFLYTDRTFLDAHNRDDPGLVEDTGQAKLAYAFEQDGTAKYNSLENGKWDGMMSDHPRDRRVFEMPRTATLADADVPLPASWDPGSRACADDGWVSTQPAGTASSGTFSEQHCTISANAAHFARSGNGNLIAQWRVLADLGISGSSVVFGEPGRTSPFGPIMTATSAQGMLTIKGGPSPWLEYDFATTTAGPATLALHLLPTFPIDSDHKLRYAVALDDGAPMERDMSGSSGGKATGAGDGPSGADWPQNVLRNSAIDTLALGALTAGKHTLRLLYRDPGVVFEHIVITFPGAPPAYPVPPETR